MYKKTHVKTFLVFFIILLIGCNEVTIITNSDVRNGSGVNASESRTLNVFSEIQLKSSASVNISFGERQSVVVSADDNLLDIITTEVSGKTLIIRTRESFSTQVGVKVDITLSNLRKTSTFGSGDIVIRGLSNNDFTASITGSGNINASGKVDNIEINISGSGNADFSDLKAKNASAKVTGSGQVDIYATKTLLASIVGSGDIRYTGRPKINSNITGSGRIKSR